MQKKKPKSKNSRSDQSKLCPQDLPSRTALPRSSLGSTGWFHWPWRKACQSQGEEGVTVLSQPLCPTPHPTLAHPQKPAAPPLPEQPCKASPLTKPEKRCRSKPHEEQPG